MASVPFHYIDLRAFCYATEDEKRVAGALRTFLPEEFEIDRATSDGHAGELDDRVDDNTSFYLTLDKQAAFRGTVRRGDGLTLRAKVEAYPATREKAVENARAALDEFVDDG